MSAVSQEINHEVQLGRESEDVTSHVSPAAVVNVVSAPLRPYPVLASSSYREFRALQQRQSTKKYQQTSTFRVPPSPNRVSSSPIRVSRRQSSGVVSPRKKRVPSRPKRVVASPMRVPASPNIVPASPRGKRVPSRPKRVVASPMRVPASPSTHISERTLHLRELLRMECGKTGSSPSAGKRGCNQRTSAKPQRVARMGRKQQQILRLTRQTRVGRLQCQRALGQFQQRKHQLEMNSVMAVTAEARPDFESGVERHLRINTTLAAQEQLKEVFLSNVMTQPSPGAHQSSRVKVQPSPNTQRTSPVQVKSSPNPGRPTAAQLWRRAKELEKEYRFYKEQAEQEEERRDLLELNSVMTLTAEARPDFESGVERHLRLNSQWAAGEQLNEVFLSACKRSPSPHSNKRREKARLVRDDELHRSRLVAKAILGERFATRDEAATTVKLQSTLQGKRVVQSSKSGGGRIVFRCARCEGDGDPMYKCDYQCVVAKVKSQQWVVKKFDGHSDACLSKPKMTFAEAAMCTSNNGSNQAPSSILDTRFKICGENHVPKKAVSTSVANKLRLHHCRMANSNYDVNWAKLDAWAEEFMSLNPGSHAHVDVDGSGAFFRMFVGVEPATRVSLKCGIDFSGIDGTFYEHIFFDKGVGLVFNACRTH